MDVGSGVFTDEVDLEHGGSHEVLFVPCAGSLFHLFLR